MADPIPEARTLMYPQETNYRSSVSQALLYKLGAMLNFLNKRHIETVEFTLDGNYSSDVLVAGVYNAIDGIFVFEFPVEIVNIWIINRIKGTAGQTTLDVKWKANDSSTWASIFLGSGGVAPSILPAAANFEVCGIGDSKTGFIAANPIRKLFDAKDAIRVDLTQAMSGSPSGCGIVINYRPR